MPCVHSNLQYIVWQNLKSAFKLHAVWFYKKRCKMATSDSFLNLWGFPVVGFLNSKPSFLIFPKNDTLVS